MGLLSRKSAVGNIKLTNKSSDSLLAWAEVSLNQIGRALEAYRFGDPLGVAVAKEEADRLAEILAEVDSRR